MKDRGRGTLCLYLAILNFVLLSMLQPGYIILMVSVRALVFLCSYDKA